jgi:hypothetical protein
MNYLSEQVLREGVKIGEYSIKAVPTAGDLSEWDGSLSKNRVQMGSMKLSIVEQTARLHHIQVNPGAGDRAVPIFLCFFLCVLDMVEITQLEVDLPSPQYVGPLEAVGFKIDGLKARTSIANMQKTCQW